MFLTFAVIGISLAAIGGVVSTLAAARILTTSREISARVEAVERRLLVTQVRILAESVMAEAFLIDQVSSTLKKMMIEDAIADGTHTSEKLAAKISSIDKQTGSVAAIQREALQRCQNDARLDAQNSDILGKILTRSESQLVKLRRVRKMFEKKLQAHSDGEQLFSEDTV